VSSESLLFEKQDRVATITLNRPERHNAFNIAMAAELRETWERVKKDAEIVVVVLTASGDKAFCTGMEVGDVADGSARVTARGDVDDPPWFHLTSVQNHCWKPVITAVNGMVVGGGLHFIADSDLILAAEHATFFDTHVKLGMIAGLEPVGLLRRIPLEAVLRMAFLGGFERMDAKRAYELGLVGEVLPKEQLLPRARELAAKIAEHSPEALARTKQALWESLDLGLHDALRRAWRMIQAHNGHPDLDEGTKAFVERRKPRWAPSGG
jgi:E-phenylitaconyl-CoA hydratase